MTARPSIVRCRLQGITKASPSSPNVPPPIEQNVPLRFFEKDILRTGEWAVGPRRWLVTAQTLRQLVANFELAKRRGVRIPVVWNHSWDVRDKIGEVIALRQHGDTLWARFWARRPSDVMKLGSTANEVSVEVAQPWRDGFGHTYDIMLIHLAVVHLPVVPNQFPFRELRLSHPMSGAIRMSDQPTAVAGVQETSTAHRALVRVLNQLLARLPSWSLVPEEISLEDLARQLGVLVEQFENPPDSTDDSQATIQRLQAEVDELNRQLSLERTRSAERQRRQFEQVLDRLVIDGRISPADRDGLLEAGEPTGYRLSLLAPFEKLPSGAAFPLRPLARTAADPSPPSIAPHREMSSERAREIAQCFKG